MELQLPKCNSAIITNTGRTVNQLSTSRGLRGPGRFHGTAYRGSKRQKRQNDDGDSDSEPHSRWVPWKTRFERIRSRLCQLEKVDVAMYTATAGVRREQQAASRAAEIAEVQQRLDTADAFCSSCGSTASSGLTCVERTRAAYFGLRGTSGYVDVPTYLCSCGAAVSIHPFQVSCVGTAPLQNTTLLSMDLVETFSHEHHSAGVSSHSKCCCRCPCPCRCRCRCPRQPARRTSLPASYAKVHLAGCRIRGADPTPSHKPRPRLWDAGQRLAFAAEQESAGGCADST
jgi:hypothetical protein